MKHGGRRKLVLFANAVFVLPFLAGCIRVEAGGGGAPATETPAPTASPTPPPEIDAGALTSLTEGEAAAAETYEDAYALFLESREEIAGRMTPPDGRGLLAEEEFLVFATVFAYLSAGYGASGEFELDPLLAASELDCDNYVALVVRLLERFRLEQQTDVQLGLRMVGWHGGAVANHAQLFAFRPDGTGEMFFDPTVAVLGYTGFEHVASSRSVPANHLYDFGTRSELDSYGDTISGALIAGAYRPLDLLYYYEETERFFDPPIGSAAWPTPGAVRLRADGASFAHPH